MQGATGTNPSLSATIKSTTYGHSVVAVEGFFDTIAVHQAGSPVVGLMGSTLSHHQADLFAGHFDRVVPMLDGDEAGRQGAMSIAQTLATRMSVVPIVLDNGRQPDQMTPQQTVDVLSTSLIRTV